ncbi:hypothetical protein ACFWJU_18640 [Streptomyces mutabilis]|uniref:VG15 protein n=1 Tax=Streptomyces mutabilis TaxID=67332 RepID=UPI0036538635
MSVPPAAQDHQQQRAAQAAMTAAAVRQVWSTVDPDNLEQSWLARAALVAELIRRGQLTAASTAEPWLTTEVGPGEGSVDPVAAVEATGDLQVPLLYPMLIALNRLRRGFTTAMSILSGAYFLEMVTRTLVADAGRIADMAGMIARPRVVSYVRVVELPACARCIILAGREYSFSEGFLRHPRCDCTIAPRRPGDTWELAGPKQLFNEMTAAQQRKAFGAAAVDAIGEGADIAQVVNARRGMDTVTAYGRKVQATREGVTRRGIAGARLITGDPTALIVPRSSEGDMRVVSEFTRRTRTGRQQLVRLRGAKAPRLMPEEIYRQADDREHAIRLLKRNGYIV